MPHSLVASYLSSVTQSGFVYQTSQNPANGYLSRFRR